MSGAILRIIAYSWHRFWCGWHIVHSRPEALGNRHSRKARYHALKREQWS